MDMLATARNIRKFPFSGPTTFGHLLWKLWDGVKAAAPAYLLDEAGRNEHESTIRRSHCYMCPQSFCGGGNGMSA